MMILKKLFFYLVILLIASLHAISRNTNSNARELVIVKKAKTPVLVLDSGDLSIVGFISQNQVLTVTESSKDYYKVEFSYSPVWNFRSLLGNNPRLLFVRRADVIQIDKASAPIAKKTYSTILDSIGYYYKNWDSKKSLETVYVDSLAENEFDTVARIDFYYFYQFDPIQLTVLPFIIKTKDASLLNKYITTVAEKMSGSAEATELLSHQLVRGAYCDIDFMISAVNQEKNSDKRRFLKKTIIRAIDTYWGIQPFSNFNFCKYNLYVAYADSKEYAVFMDVTIEKIIKKIKQRIKD